MSQKGYSSSTWLIGVFFHAVAMVAGRRGVFLPVHFYLLPTQIQDPMISEHIHVVRHSETYQGIIRPILVDLLRLTRKPTVGSVMASQARPTNRMMDA